MDFMSDATTDGRKLRTFNVIDDFNREALTVKIARSWPAKQIITVLDEIALVNIPFLVPVISRD
jgi:putative transposase